MNSSESKIAALCKKHGFECCPDGPFALQFDRWAVPRAHFQLHGVSPNLEQVYQKFLAVLQAMGWEPATSATLESVSAGSIPPGPSWYEITKADEHATLKIGDIVQMVECPNSNNWLYRADGTLHDLRGKKTYVMLIGHSPA